ncbi:MAG: hypothetical protein JKY08_07715 [Flavobacteriaceae bacterium]|nr:hypothetical protein [Flavobacteriaceae bacterium]
MNNEPQKYSMIWALILIWIAYTGYTVLGTENAFFGILAMGFVALQWRHIIGGLGSLIWIVAIGGGILIATWATSPTSTIDLPEMIYTMRYFFIFPALLIFARLFRNKKPLSRIIRDIKRKFLD